MCQAFGECSETSNSKKEALPGRVVLNAPVMSVSLESFGLAQKFFRVFL